jgi:M-phase inducer tyrosine phosphatase
MQVSTAASSTNPHFHSQFPVSALSIKAVQDDVEDLLSSDLEISFASSMSINSALPGPIKLVDNVSGEDIVPMDISPEPSRTIHQPRIFSGHLLEKVTRTRAFTTSVGLFGRVRVVSNQAQPHTITHKVNPIIL